MAKQNDEDDVQKYISSLTNDKLWEAYFFLRESVERLPKVSSYKLLYILFHNYKDVENPMYEFAKTAIRLLKRLTKEIQNRNLN